MAIGRLEFRAVGLLKKAGLFEFDLQGLCEEQLIDHLLCFSCQTIWTRKVNAIMQDPYDKRKAMPLVFEALRRKDLNRKP